MMKDDDPIPTIARETIRRREIVAALRETASQ